jgi:hypothetical protein
LGRLLSTAPADRPAAEAAITELYRGAGLGRPQFCWVSSPLLVGCTGEPGVAARAAPDWESSPVLDRLSRMCLEPWDRLEGASALFDTWVAQPFSRSWADCAAPVLTAVDDYPYPIQDWFRRFGWYWVWAGYPGLRGGDSGGLWQAWETVAMSCGVWWPRRYECVVAERPQAVYTEPAGDLGEMRLHRADGPAVRYADGWELHFWHGTRVPEWVITAPTAAAIDAEPNVEVRRCAIEHLGWPVYMDLDQAGMRLLATAPDPGNRGFELLLYDDVARSQHILIAVNGSLERDGTRRRYGLGVPGHFTDPVAAAAWTYGLTAAEYSLLVQRT